MKTVALGDVVESISTWKPRTFPDSSFMYIDLGSVDNETKRIKGTSTFLGCEAPSRARQIVKCDDIVVSTVRPNLNAVALIPRILDGATASTGFTVLRPSSKIDAKYLYHWVRSAMFVSLMVKRATGASYPAVSDKIVKASHVPLPTLEEQKRIAKILDKADSIRAKRRQVLDHLDALSQSIFHDMFETCAGDSLVPLADMADIVSGVTKGRRTSEPTQDVPYLAVVNVQAGHLKLSEVKHIEATSSEIQRYSLREGDLILTEGGDPDKLGRGAMWRGEIPVCIHQNHIFRVRLNDDSSVLPEYMEAYLSSRSAKDYFLKSAKQTTGIASINMRQLKSLPVKVPSIDSQRKFVSLIASIVSHKLLVEEQLRSFDLLFTSLQSRAFKGEL